MTTKQLAAAVAAALAALTLAACDRETQQKADREGAEIAQKANHALATTEEKLKEAGHVAKEKLDQAGEKTSQALSNASSRTDAAIHDTADRATSSETGRNAREAMSDGAITASIKTDFLKDPDLSVLKIDVDTKDGVVTLQGLADNDGARTRAERIAQGVKGVKEVRNYLVAKKPV
jgi:hyperosmotically inducible periplasmic protein